VARKTSPALVRAISLAALALALASCGGGSTAGPVARTGVSTTPAATPPARTQPPAATATTPAAPPRTTAIAPATPAKPSAPRSARSRSSGGAAPPPARDGGSLADAPAGKATAPAPASAPAESTLDERAKLVLTRRVSPAHYFQQGTVTGTYAGTMEVEARITSKGVLVRFTATLPGGTISGRGVAVAILDSATWPGLRGRAIVTGGTGRFAGIYGRGLRVTGRARPDASRAHVRLAGMVSGI